MRATAIAHSIIPFLCDTHTPGGFIERNSIPGSEQSQAACPKHSAAQTCLLTNQASRENLVCTITHTFWSKLLTWHFSYTPKQEGLYQLLVRSINEDGDASPLPDSVEFEVFATRD